ncbi:MAG: dihydroxy-acid dehydratase, partial [Pseudomonadota bacterium]|nr:dihydroxy-acid dehydratase [Pseudomonadota bacterium]
SILHASPESAAGGGLALLRTGDLVRVDLTLRSCNMLVPEDELDRRRAEPVPATPPSQTPWQEIYRATVGQLDSGACMELALGYRGVGQNLPRHNH